MVMKKWNFVLENISSKIVLCISMVILAAFTYWAGKYTHLINIDLVNLKVRLYEDSIVKNLGWFLCVLVIFGGISKIILKDSLQMSL